MKSKMMAIGVMLSLSGASFAMDRIKMPAAEVLRERLTELAMDHFMEHTNIIEQLADQEKAPLGVALTIETAVHDYSKYLTEGGAGPTARIVLVTFNMNKPFLFEALLKDEPKALEQLKELGLYTPAK